MRRALGTLSVLAAVGATAGEAEAARQENRRAKGPARPGVVFILVDDLRHDDLGLAGHPFVETPNIDRIGREGARFDRAFATTPLKALHPNVVQRDDGSMGDVAGQPSGFVAAPRHRGRYAKTRIPHPTTYGRPPLGKPALLRPVPGLPPLGPETVTSDETVRQRLEMLLAVDESLGRIRAELVAQGRWDDTLVVVTGDNGFFYGEHGLSEERRLAYEGSIRIPLVVRYPPRIPAGRVVDSLVLGLDLAPTIVEAAGLPPDAGHQGRSLWPLLGGREASWRRSFLVEYWSDTVFPRIRNMGYQAVRTTRHKYIRYGELSGMDEIYDLAADPDETTNLVGSKGGERLLADLDKERLRLLAETGERTGRASP
jgi:N-acetylglucosamine-6-sulfatase